MDRTALLDAMRAELPAVLADIETLVLCESPSANADAVAASADVVSRIGEKWLGQPPERILRDGVPHLLWRFGDIPSRVLLLGHHDTVWPFGALASHPCGTTRGVLRGPGCFDMKTGLVMAFQAAAALDDPSGLTILVTGDEEVGSPSSRDLIETEAAGCSAALVLEASADSGALKSERKGVSQYEVRAYGIAAHAGLEPERGVNATVELAHQVHAVCALADAAEHTTVTPTLLSAGTTTNTVPAAGGFTVDVRVRTGREQRRVDDAMRALEPVLPGARLELRGGPNRPPLNADASAGLYARAEKIAASLGLSPLGSAAVGGASDGNFTAGLGIPTLDGLGAVGGGAHADHEHVLVSEIPSRVAVLAALIAELLTSEPRSSSTNQADRLGVQRP
jgi:glutamate carboxypeptidase